MATITGTAGDDIRNGTAQGDLISLLGGDDFSDARQGNDRVFGGGGEDELYGFHGRNSLFGGNGADLLLGENQNDTLYGDGGSDLLDGGLSDDVLFGGNGSDEMFGAQGGDTLYGGDSADLLDGGAGPFQSLTDGNDVLFGGRGDDVLDGALGFDVLYGGAGSDKFLYVGGTEFSTDSERYVRFAFERDVAADFVKGVDHIELLDFDAVGGVTRDIPFTRLDSNDNHVLDDGDRFVEVRNASIPGSTQLSTVIDVEAALGLNIEGTNTLTVLGVVGLTESDFV